jgi:hypothetical protein
MPQNCPPRLRTDSTISCGRDAAGGIFTMLCDDLARTLLAGEIPLVFSPRILAAIIFIAR